MITSNDPSCVYIWVMLPHGDDSYVLDNEKSSEIMTVVYQSVVVYIEY